MTAREAELLLGGYAAGILTDEERSGLFAAALDNQALFDALVDEEALRSLMADPRSRAELLRAVTAESDDPALNVREEQFDFARARSMMPAAGVPRQAPVPVPARESRWRRFFRPAPLAAFSAVAVAALGLVVVLRPRKVAEVQTAKVSEVKDTGVGALRNDAPPPAAVSPRKPETVARVVKSSELEREAQMEARLRSPEVDRDRLAMRDEEKPKAAPQAEQTKPPAAVVVPAPATAPAVAPARQASQSQSQALSQSQSQSQSLSQPQSQAVEERKADLARAPVPPAESPGAPAAPAARRSSPIGGALSGLGARQENAVATPINVWIELDRTRTTQTEFKAGDSVRIVVEARVSGRLRATIDERRAVSTDARARQRYTIPSRGSLRSEAGEREVELTFEPATGEVLRKTLRISFR